MGVGLQIFRSDGVKMFDSAEAVGGACIGFVTVPASGYDTVFSYPEFGAGRQGFVINDIGGNQAVGEEFRFENWKGYPEFIFPPKSYTRSALLFIK